MTGSLARKQLQRRGEGTHFRDSPDEEQTPGVGGRWVAGGRLESPG